MGKVKVEKYGVEHTQSGPSAKPAGLQSGHPPAAQCSHGHIRSGTDARLLAEEPEAAAAAVALAQLQMAAPHDDLPHSPIHWHLHECRSLCNFHWFVRCTRRHTPLH